MKSALAVFARAPQPGEVKSRLARTIGKDAAASCYAAFLHDTFELARQIEYSRSDCRAIVAFTPATAFGESENSLSNFWRGDKMPQRGADIGARMLHCIAALHADGVERVVLIGSDSPDLPQEYVARAFVSLENKALVFGSARDGGFYLIGANAEYSARLHSLFDGVQWSAPSTLRQVLSNAEQLQLETKLLPLWSDVDTVEDLQKLQERLQREYSRAPHTSAWLRSQNLF